MCDIKRNSWNDWFALAQEYFTRVGDLLVAEDYVSPEGYRLGRWIERQRGKYNGKILSGISAEQVAMLESIGMVWKLETRTEFDKWIGLAEKYKKEYGDLLIGEAEEYLGMQLGQWVAAQRKKYSAKKLTEAEIGQLENIGMVWSLGERRPWMEWYREAKEYYEKQGNLLVPLAYISPEGSKLGKWVFSQRDKRRYVATYSAEKVRLLDEIGMVWSLKDKK